DCVNASNFGAILASGHFNSDRFSDVVISGNRGGPALFLGSSSGLSSGPAQSVFLGSVARSAGDVDGDRIDDLVIRDGLWGNGESFEGAVGIYLGGAALPSTTPVWQVEGNQPLTGFGNVVGAGDTDGDGLANVLVGAPQYDFSQPDDGAVFLFF